MTRPRFLLTPAVVEAWDLRVTGLGSMAPNVYQVPPPEAALIEWAAQFVDPDRVALDIGAHVGSWCLTLADRAKRWIAFEPCLATYNALCGSVALNGLDYQVRPVRMALASAEQSRALEHVSADGGGNRLMPPQATRSANSAEIVPVSSLNHVVWVDGGSVGFLKIDAEGSELEILRGAVQTLEGSEWPPILLECWTPASRAAPPGFEAKAAELWAFVRKLGYRRTAVAGWPEMNLLERADS